MDAQPVQAVASPTLFGRNGELQQLHETLARAIEFRTPQVVTLLGGPGTGKTALVQSFLASVAPEVRVFRALAGQAASAIAGLLAHRFNITGAPNLVARDKLRTQFAELGARLSPEMHTCLAALVGVELGETPFLALLRRDRDRYRDISRAVLRRFIEIDAERRPVVVFLDDLQHADADSIDTLANLARELSGVPVLIVVAARPEKAWLRHWDVDAGADGIRINLRNLEPADAAALVRHELAPCGTIDEEVVDAAVDMTGGNPLFVKQLVRLFIAKSAIVVGPTRWTMDVDRALAIELPLTVEDAIAARIAALDEHERSLLEKAVVLGNVFWKGALVALRRQLAAGANSRDYDYSQERVYRWENDDDVRDDVEKTLSALVQRDYLLELPPEDSSIPCDIEYVFKHNLERELIAAGIDETRSAAVYAAAAEWLDLHLVERASEQLEFIGGLFEKGLLTERAARAYREAGDLARKRFSNEQAASLYRRCVELLPVAPSWVAIDVLHDLGDVYDRLGATEQAVESFRKMLHAAWLLDHFNKAGAAHGRLGRIYRRLGEFDEAIQHLQSAEALYQKVRDQRGIASALDDIGRIHALRGAYRSALECHRQALVLRQSLGDRRSLALSMANIACVHYESGNFAAAIAQLRESLDLRRDVGDVVGVALSLCQLGVAHLACEQSLLAQEMLREAEKLGSESGDASVRIIALRELSRCELALGRTEHARAQLQQAVDLATRAGNRVDLAATLLVLADLHLSCSENDLARDVTTRALAIAEAVGLRPLVGFAQRVQAAVGIAQGRAHDEIKADFELSASVLAAIGCEVELARTHSAFADFCDLQGQRGAAHECRRKAVSVQNALREALAA